MPIDIRESLPTDSEDLETLYRDAFPEEDLVPLVRELLCEERGVLSLVATIGGEIVGHIIFTDGTIGKRTGEIGLLGPLAVASAHQRHGVGSALANEGLRRLRLQGVSLVCVLGDPAYYGRFGFECEEHVQPPYALPPEWLTAWQSIRLSDDHSPLQGQLSLPQPWRQPSYWQP